MIQGTHNNTKGINGKGPKYVEKLFNNINVEDCEKIVLNEYLNYFGKEKGISEYNKNFVCLKILDSYEDMEFPELKTHIELYAKTLGMAN